MLSSHAAFTEAKGNTRPHTKLMTAVTSSAVGELTMLIQLKFGAYI